MKLSDLSSADFYRDPYPLYRTLRAEGPLVQAAPHILMTGRYDVIDALLLDRRMGKGYMQSIRARYGDKGPDQPAFQALARTFLMMNPPEHTRLRSLLMKAFNARGVESLRDVSQQVADALVDAFPQDEPFDLVQMYTQPLPVKIICSLLDVPVDDARMLGGLVGTLGHSLEAAPLDADGLAKVNAAALALEDYFRVVVQQRRRKPGSDLVSMLLSVEEEGERLSEEEVISNVILLFAAGHETTSNMIGNALIALHRYPDQLALLKARPDLLPKAVAECMRYDSSVQFLTRMALEDTEVDGIKLPKGAIVFMLLGAGNRDPQRFQESDRLLIERPESGNRLIMFGGGIHYCLGARLATLQIQIALGTLLARLPDLQLLNTHDLRWYPRNTLRGVESLMAAARLETAQAA